MTKVVAYMLVLALVLFVSANSVHGDESPTIYEQLDEAKEEAQEAVKKTSDSATGNEPQVEEQSKIAETTPSKEESKDSGETPSTEESKTPENTTSTEETKTSESTAPAEDSKTSSSSWGQWVVNKLEHIGVISEKSKPGSSAATATATEETPAPGPSGDSPTPI